MTRQFTKNEAITLLANSDYYVNQETELKQKQGKINFQTIKESGKFTDAFVDTLEETMNEKNRTEKPDVDKNTIAISSSTFAKLFPDVNASDCEHFAAYQNGLTISNTRYFGSVLVADESKNKILFRREAIEKIAGMSLETAQKRYSKGDIERNG